MKENISAENSHPAGEPENRLVPGVPPALLRSALIEADLVTDTPDGRFRVNFDELTPLCPLGSLVFFAQFLQASGPTQPAGALAPRGCAGLETADHRGGALVLRLAHKCGAVGCE